MTVKTNDLLGAQLDCAVAQAEGITWYIDTVRVKGATTTRVYEERGECSAAFQPSTDWAHGGPIIEREKLCADYLLDGRWLAVSRITEKQGLGPTPLIAAMRCYVASKLGDTVETNN